MIAVIILAAGLATRFDSTRHKALSPLLLGEGSLRRLVRQLSAIVPSHKIVVVTGHNSESIGRDALAANGNLKLEYNASFSKTTVLQSLCCGLNSLRATPDIKGVWVLFADTVYDPAALIRLTTTGADNVIVGYAAFAGEDDNVIGLTFNRSDSRLLAIGPSVSPRDGVMVPMTYWPRSTWRSLLKLTEKGVGSQWQAILEIGLHEVYALELNAGAAQDIDRQSDIAKRRAELLHPEILDYFRVNISKDERNRDRIDEITGDQFRKISTSPTDALLEVSALQWLARQDGEVRVPNVSLDGTQEIILEYAQGIRFYDLLRLLGELAVFKPSIQAEATQFAITLTERCVLRLGRIQEALLRWPGASGLTPYPLHTHVSQLLSALLHLLGLPQLTESAWRELKLLEEVWSSRCALIPFRDATPKNVLIAVAELAPTASVTKEQRLEKLAKWLTHADPWNVEIVDFDFASVRHLTAPEDDLISLLAHSGSISIGKQVLSQLCPLVTFVDAIAILPERLRLPFEVNRERTALALLVRYLRFGGRKLMYRFVNPAAYAVRFRYDDPVYYFRALPDLIESLDPDFSRKWPNILSQLRLIAANVPILPPWDPDEASSDFYLQSLGPGLRFWQESPTELQGHAR
jgi:choline kinase